MGAFDPNFISMFRDRFGGPDQQPQQGLPPEVAAYAQQRAMPLPPPGASEDELRNAHNRDLLVNVLGHGQGTNEAYLNQVQQARQADYARQKALVEADPDSELSRAHRAAIKQMTPQLAAMPGFDRMSSALLGRVLPESKNLLESGDKRYGIEHEDTRAGNTLGGENTRAANSLAEERRHHLAEEEAARLKAEQDKTKEREPKPVPEQEAAKVVNQTEALKALDELEALHGRTNGFAGGVAGLSPVGDTDANRYRDAVNASIAAIAAGSAPMGRETPGLMEKIESELPGALTGHERAHAAFEQMRARIRANAQGQTAVLKAGGYNPEQVAELAKRANASARASSGGAPDLRTRIAEMKAEGVTDPKAIKAQLKREGLY